MTTIEHPMDIQSEVLGQETVLAVAWLEPNRIETPLGTKVLAGAAFTESNGAVLPAADATLVFGDQSVSSFGSTEAPADRIRGTLAAAVENEATHVLLARNPSTNEITATLTFVELSDGRLMIEDVVVDENARGPKGCGELDGMLQYLSDYAEANNSPAIMLTTEPTRPDAVRAYEKRGFGLVEDVAVYVPDPNANHDTVNPSGHGA